MVHISQGFSEVVVVRNGDKGAKQGGRVLRLGSCLSLRKRNVNWVGRCCSIQTAQPDEE